MNLGKCFKFKERYLNLLHEFTYFPLIVLQYIPSITAKKCPKTYRNEKSRFKFLSWQKKLIVGKDVLKICSKFKGEHPCQSVMSMKLLCNFIEITLRHGCSPANLLHTSITSFLENTSGELLWKCSANKMF